MTDRITLLHQLRKEFGDNSIFLLGQSERLMNIKVRSSGSLLLDVALGGGYPHGRLVELRGAERSGKTTLLNLAIAAAQQNEPDKECAILDLEQSYNPEWARTLGVDVDRLFFTQPDTYAERVYEMLEYMLKTRRFSVIGLDSLAGLVPKEEFEQDDWDKESRVGGMSKINARMVRKIVNTGLLTSSGTTVIFINQLRDKIGAFSPYGTPTEAPGGRALRHAYTQQLDVSVGEQFAKGTGENREVFGQKIRVKVAKNKIYPPHKQASIDLYYEYGVDKVSELVNVAKELNILAGTSWLTFIDPRTGEVFQDSGTDIKFHGQKKAVEALKEDILNNGGRLYTQMMNLVQDILRGE